MLIRKGGTKMRLVHAADLQHEPAGTARFAGEAWQANAVGADDGDLRGNVFSYAPGARSHWHIHTGEQALVVLYGRGLVQWEGGEVVSVEAGDWLHVTPGVPHWHGARSDAPFAHIAVTASGSTIWLDPVSDDLSSA
jgi:quercetin dioxygenase-like cupin family protein